jgi:hypothetical protein
METQVSSAFSLLLSKFTLQSYKLFSEFTLQLFELELTDKKVKIFTWECLLYLGGIWCLYVSCNG